MQQAKDLVSNKTQYIGFENLGENMQASRMHQQLLAAYAKVQKAYQ